MNSRHLSVIPFYKKPKYQLFFMTLPFVALVIIFAYQPLYGWIYAFFDFKPGIPLFQNKFAGFSNFINLVNTPTNLQETFRVLVNTLAISGLQILSTPLPILFAIYLSEIRSKSLRKIIQTTTTLPNFISWILVYSVAFSMFSVEDGFVNRLLLKLNVLTVPMNILGSPDNVWITQTLFYLWKTLGWSAIIYLAAIAGIDAELYDAADVDGANRMQRIRHITIPSLLPTYFVLLLLAVANLINNGLDQYFVFQNPMTKPSIEVLDLYVYNQGIASINYGVATAISMFKSIVSITLLMFVNRLSKTLRGFSIF